MLNNFLNVIYKIIDILSKKIGNIIQNSKYTRKKLEHIEFFQNYAVIYLTLSHSITTCIRIFD